MPDEIPDDGQVYITTDAQQLIKAIRSAAALIFGGMIVLGLMIWQPWASPIIEDVQRGGIAYTCVTYKTTADCE
ncbi:hypothetical protein GCM10027289_24100 [Tsukamurella serpentis]